MKTAYAGTSLASPSAVSPCCLNVTAHLDDRFGGMTTSLPPFCHALESTGRYRSELAAFCSPDEVQSGSQSTHIFPLGRVRWMLDAALRNRLAGLIRQAAAVHIHGIWQEHIFMASSLASANRKPYLVSAHGMLEPWAFRSKGWKKRLYWEIVEKQHFRSAHCLRALTFAEREQYRELGLRAPVAVIPNGVTVPASISAEPFWQLYPGLREKKILLFLGRLHPKKGVHLLCDTWTRLRRDFPDAHLVLAGPDSEGLAAALSEKLNQSGAGSQVTFTGMLRGDQKWAALAAASVFLLPSYSEGFSVAALEAMGAGAPVILSAQCYFPEVLEYGCGWVIEPEPASLENALRECLELPAERLHHMGTEGRRLVAERFSWPAIGERTANVLDWLLGGGPAPDCVETV
jgi:glycosyltransferase involved in cell wall biosynthesis